MATNRSFCFRYLKPRSLQAYFDTNNVSPIIKKNIKNNIHILSSRFLLSSSSITITKATTTHLYQPRRALHSSKATSDATQSVIAANDNSGIISLKSRSGSVVENGKIYFVSTPIGNMKDITLRAIEVLKHVDIIASEDTRRTGKLLQNLGIKDKKQFSHHDKNLVKSIPNIISCARSGASIAIVSDAGTPGISDPGLELVNACRQSNIEILPVPGCCALIASISISGFLSNQFVYMGFLPAKGAERRKRIKELIDEKRTIVFYEAPHRFLKTLGDIIETSMEYPHSVAQTREILVAREITKLNEEYYRGTLQSAFEYFKEYKHKVKGEFSITIGPINNVKGETSEKDNDKIAIMMIKDLLQEGLTHTAAVKTVVEEMGIKKSKVYQFALDIIRENETEKEKK